MKGHKIHRIVVDVPAYMPPEYKQFAFQQAKEEAGMELYKILEQFTTPCVVEIHEEIYPFDQLGGKVYHGHPQTPIDEIRIDIGLTPVQYRNVTFDRVLDFPTALRTLTLKERIKFLFTGKIT